MYNPNEEDITEEWVRAEVERVTAPDQDDPMEMLATVAGGGVTGAMLMIRQAVAAMELFSTPEAVSTPTHEGIVQLTTHPAYKDLVEATEAMTEAVAALMWKTHECNCAECQRQAREDAAPFN